MKSLKDKELELLQSVALPQADDWQLLRDMPEVVTELNNILVNALAFAKTNSGDLTWGQIADQIFPFIKVLAEKHPNLGITDSDGFLTVARFFGVNYSPAIYDYFRYYGAEPEFSTGPACSP